jgi:hypothetical protein
LTGRGESSHCLVAPKVLRLSGCLAVWVVLEGQVAGFGRKGGRGQNHMVLVSLPGSELTQPTLGVVRWSVKFQSPCFLCVACLAVYSTGTYWST